MALDGHDMQRLVKPDEQDIQALIAEGVDEEIARLLCTLVALKQHQKTPRTIVLEELGERYLTLALSREKDLVGQDLETALKRLYSGLLRFSPEIGRDTSAIAWYEEALNCLEEALKIAPANFDKSRTIRLACLARTLFTGKLNE